MFARHTAGEHRRAAASRSLDVTILLRRHTKKRCHSNTLYFSTTDGRSIAIKQAFMDEGMEVGRERWRTGRGSGIWREGEEEEGMDRRGSGRWRGNKERMERGRGV